MTRQLFRRMSGISSRGPIYTSIETKLTQSLKPQKLIIRDDSSLHAGHAAMKGLKPVESHFHVEIVSEAFTGKSSLQRHRMIYDILDQEMKNGIHALQIKASPPTSSATHKQ
ncbi:hypothetical protein MP228_005115 [Amoeboaphelidium protococcarum]|nr:hypothetical protein MP228_005115 [Amoeboaphelidium protococcarum]